MRLKLLFENIKHHFVLTCFIILSLTVLMTSVILSQEIDDFTVNLSQDEYKRMHNDFDIVITSNTGLSIKGTRGENNEFDKLYERRCGFYNVSLLVQGIDFKDIVNVFEGTSDNLNLAFEIGTDQNQNEAVVTFEFAEKHRIKLNDNFDIYIGDEKITYKVKSIVDTKGLADGSAIFITGYNIAQEYAFRNMYNLILLDVENDNIYSNLLSHIKNEYSKYQVKDINDLSVIETLAHSTLSEILLIICLLFIIIFIILLKLLDSKLQKQKTYFKNILKTKYYKNYELLYGIFILVISIILSILLSNLIFNYLLIAHACRLPYKLKISSVVISVIVSCIVYLAKMYINLPKKFNRKIYLLVVLVLNIIALSIYLIFIKHHLNILFKYIVITCSILLLLEVIFQLMKYILKFKERIYIYNLSSQNLILTVLQYTYIFIVIVISIVLTSINTYSSQIDGIDKVIDIDKVVITKVSVSINEDYEQIRISNNGILLGSNLEVVVSVDINQLDKYINYGTLKENEKILFNSSDNYVILSKYYKNIHNLDVGDTVELCVNEKTEEYKVLTFVNHIYKKIAIVNNTKSMYYGYIIDEENINQNIVEDFADYPYSIINFKDRLNSFKNSLDVTLSIVKLVLICVILLIIIFSVYVSYQEYVYNVPTLRKLKLLGFNNITMIKVSIVKFLYNFLVIIILGFVFSFLMLVDLDNLLSLLKTILYINYDIKIILISIGITIICLVVGYLYSLIKYCKLK